MPANVSDHARATVTAGLANEVEEVKKYAPPIHAGTSSGPSRLRPVRASDAMTNSSRRWRRPYRATPRHRTGCRLASYAGRSNIRFATATQTRPPAT